MNEVLHVLPHPGGGAERIVDMLVTMDGYSHRRVYVAKGRSPLAAGPGIATRWPRLARRARAADLVHVIGDMAALLTLPLINRSPSVFGTHGLHFLRRAQGTRGWIARKGVARVVRAADRTVCTSRAEVGELAQFVPTARDRLVFVANGIPTAKPLTTEERLAARKTLGLPPEALVTLFLGQLEERKDPLTAVRAARRARADGAPVVLVVAGEGPLRRDVEAEGGEAVRALGHRDDVSTLLAAADLLTLPSRREGLPLSVLEAMAAGLPVVVSDADGNLEAVGDAGLTLPPGDVRGFADAYARLAANPGERERLGLQGRRRVEEHFGVERYVAEMRNVFDSVLGG